MKKRQFLNLFICLLGLSFTSCSDAEKNSVYLKFISSNGERGGVSNDATNGYYFIEDSFLRGEESSQSVIACPKRGFKFSHWELKTGPETYVEINSAEEDPKRLPHFTENFFTDYEFVDETYGKSKSNPYLFRASFIENTYKTITFSTGLGVVTIEGCTNYIKYDGENINNSVCAISQDPTRFLFLGWFDNPDGTGESYCENLQWDMINFDPGNKTNFYAVSIAIQ